jgi:uncharacterized protein
VKDAMRIAVTGATGLIGRTLVARLLERGDTVVALTRNASSAQGRLGSEVEVHEWRDPEGSEPPADALANADAVVHLIGEPVSQRWTPAVRAAIRSSRIEPTRHLVSALRGLPDGERPRVLVSGSAVGYYGPRGEERLTETAAPGDDFLAHAVIDWEREALAAEDLLRVVCVRTGVVLDADGGALATMLPIFKLGIGGPIGGGAQYIPWIHIDDEVGALLHAIDTDGLTGAVNLSAPEPATNRDFSHALGRALHRPAFWPVPGVAVKLLYGDMSTVVLNGQRAVPTELERTGFEFRYTDLETALKNVVERP